MNARDPRHEGQGVLDNQPRHVFGGEPAQQTAPAPEANGANDSAVRWHLAKEAANAEFDAGMKELNAEFAACKAALEKVRDDQLQICREANGWGGRR